MSLWQLVRYLIKHVLTTLILEKELGVKKMAKAQNDYHAKILSKN